MHTLRQKRHKNTSCKSLQASTLYKVIRAYTLVEIDTGLYIVKNATRINTALIDTTIYNV